MQSLSLFDLTQNPLSKESHIQGHLSLTISGNCLTSQLSDVAVSARGTKETGQVRGRLGNEMSIEDLKSSIVFLGI